MNECVRVCVCEMKKVKTFSERREQIFIRVDFFHAKSTNNLPNERRWLICFEPMLEYSYYFRATRSTRQVKSCSIHCVFITTNTITKHCGRKFIFHPCVEMTAAVFVRVCYFSFFDVIRYAFLHSVLSTTYCVLFFFFVSGFLCINIIFIYCKTGAEQIYFSFSLFWYFLYQ